MKPKYMQENRYSFVIDALPVVQNVDYEVDTPETRFERRVQLQLAEANRLLITGKHGTALSKFRHLRGTITSFITPHFRPLSTLKAIAGINWTLLLKGAKTAQLVESVVQKSAKMLAQTSVVESDVPKKFRDTEVRLPLETSRQLGILGQVGLQDREGEAGVLVKQATALVERGAYKQALQTYEEALNTTENRPLIGAIRHDMSVLLERTGNRDEAIEVMRETVRIFEREDQPDRQVTALSDLAGIHARGGQTDRANSMLKQANELRRGKNLVSIQPSRAPLETGRPILANKVTEEFAAQPVQLMAADAFLERQTSKQLAVLDSENKLHAIELDRNAAGNLAAFYEELSTTRDLGLLTGYLYNHTITVAYLTHVYFWVIPMAIGDCLAALGSYEEAESEYLSTLNYKYLNRVVEAPNLWIRLAELYLDWGDRLYRLARNDVSEFVHARKKYERLMRLNNTIDENSPLYRSAPFAAMKTRATAAIQAWFVNGAPIEENPRLVTALMRARIQLHKMANGLNYIGLGVHIPPFSFEYLQNVARYFAQHASQVEQMYIQFQSTGENEELRESQMAQQVDIAAASVELERRGLDEAQEGVDVADANLNYTNVQLNNAVDAANSFAAVRWELLELDTLQAWASASAVDRDDQVKLTISGYSHYSADSKRRNVVLKELANQRTRISHDMEADRLQRAVDAAAAYQGVAQQQVQQAQARVEVAEQRVAIAEMQEQHARENLQFLEGREFSSVMWYNLARESRRLAQRYLDRAIEVATMMEKAYEAETGRDLRKIKFEYGLNHLNGLLGAEALLLDIDFFSLDHVRTKSKRAQLKQTLSLADQFPMAFEQLLRTGQTFFETTLAHFDRRYPGFYLQKVKQAEVVFVGLTGTEGAHGTLRNIGLSQFRTKSGAIVNQTYPADVMPLSEYSVRQDAIVFQLDSKELRLFENNGVATMWQLDLPLATNTFDLRQILDVYLVLYYDGFFDPGLERAILQNLPASDSASRGLSLRLYAPDELFFMRSRGDAELAITPDLFPANQTHQTLTNYTIQAVGEGVAGLRLRVSLGELGASHTFTLGANGAADASTFAAPIGQPLFDTWTIQIDPADNPGFDLAGLVDLSLFVEYDFDYRQ